jgi:hypothetical protein
VACNQKSANRVRPGKLSGLITRFWASIKAQVPVAYQDDAGFQYGKESASSLLEPPLENGTGLAADLNTGTRLPE